MTASLLLMVLFGVKYGGVNKQLSENIFVIS